MKHAFTFASSALALFTLAQPAHAQCPAQWVSGTGIPGADFDINALAYHPSGEVIVGGSFQNAGGQPLARIAKYNPATGVWSNLGTSGGMNDLVRSLLVLPGGDVLVGGRFTTAGGVPANRIARYNWNSGTWSALGGPGAGGGVLGVNGGATPEVLTILLLPGGNEIIIGGVFSTSGGTGGITTNNISRYNFTTQTWSTVGTAPGTTGAVRALIMLNSDDVIAGGEFSFAGTVSAGRIAKFTLSSNSWSAIGSMSTWVHSLALHPSGDLVAGGQFTTAGGVAANRVARYNPTTGVWSSLPQAGFSAAGGLNGHGYSLAILPGSGDLIVGGSFNAVGGTANIPALSIARYTWSTSSWSALGAPGGGVNLTVWAPLVLPSGDLLIGGGFTAAGGEPANRIARFNFGASCPADFNCDSTADFFDYLDFVDAFASNAPSADFNDDGIVDFFDYLDYVDAFSSGC